MFTFDSSSNVNDNFGASIDFCKKQYDSILYTENRIGETVSHNWIK